MTKETNRKFEGNAIEDISSETIGGMSAELLSSNSIHKRTKKLENRVSLLYAAIGILGTLAVVSTSTGGYYLNRSITILEQQENAEKKCSLIDICKSLDSVLKLHPCQSSCQKSVD